MKQTTRTRLHKLLSLFMALVMAMSLLNLTVFAADVNGVPDHVHNQDGWSCEKAPDEKTLTCGLEEHTHTADCYQGEPVKTLSCGQEESEGHTHTDACNPVTTTAYACGKEEGEGAHTHSDACYEDRPIIFGDTVVGYAPMLVCGQEESAGHIHTDACGTVTTTTYSCGQEESAGHKHTDDCYTEVASLSCELPEHTHTDDCYTVTEGAWTCTPPEEPVVDPEAGEGEEEVIYKDLDGKATNYNIMTIAAGQSYTIHGYASGYTRLTNRTRESVSLLSATNNRTAYCVQEGSGLSGGYYGGWVVYSEPDTTQGLSAQQKFLIGLVINNGYHGLTRPSSGTENARKYVATQLLIWEIVDRYDNRGPRTMALNTWTSKSTFTEKWKIQYNGTNSTTSSSIYKDYAALVDAVHSDLQTLQATLKGHSPGVTSATTLDYGTVDTAKWKVSSSNATHVTYTADFGDGYSGWEVVSPSDATIRNGHLSITRIVPVGQKPSNDVTISLRKPTGIDRTTFTHLTNSGQQNLARIDQETEGISIVANAKVNGFENYALAINVVKVFNYKDTDTQLPIPGVTFELYDSTNHLVATKETDANGKIVFDGLTYPAGANPGYYLKETKGPDGLELQTGNISAGVTDGTTSVTVKVSNKATFTVDIYKVEQDGSHRALAGAQFKLEQKVGSQWKLLDDSLVSGDDGKLDVGKLYEGTYKLTETEAPEKYVTPTGDKASVEFTVDNAGNVNAKGDKVIENKLDNSFKFENEYETGGFTLTKSIPGDKNNPENLPHFKFDVTVDLSDTTGNAFNWYLESLKKASYEAVSSEDESCVGIDLNLANITNNNEQPRRVGANDWNNSTFNLFALTTNQEAHKAYFPSVERWIPDPDMEHPWLTYKVVGKTIIFEGIELANGESLEFKELPAGTTYTVSEQPATSSKGTLYTAAVDGTDIPAEGYKGNIAANDKDQVTVQNTLPVEADVDLDIYKIITSATNGSTDKSDVDEAVTDEFVMELTQWVGGEWVRPDSDIAVNGDTTTVVGEGQASFKLHFEKTIIAYYRIKENLEKGRHTTLYRQENPLHDIYVKVEVNQGSEGEDAEVKVTYYTDWDEEKGVPDETSEVNTPEIENEELHATIKLEAQKYVEDSSGTTEEAPEESFDFNLYEVTVEVGKVYFLEKDENGQLVEWNLDEAEAIGTAKSTNRNDSQSDEDIGKIQFTNENTGNALTYDEVGTHYYVIVETDTTSGYTFDRAQYLVKVNVAVGEDGYLHANAELGADGKLTVVDGTLESGKDELRDKMQKAEYEIAMAKYETEKAEYDALTEEEKEAREEPTEPLEEDFTVSDEDLELVYTNRQNPSYRSVSTSFHVEKRWVGDTEDIRPDSIDVQLYQDDVVYDTQTLSSENNWEYNWTELPTGHDYKVEEVNVPDGYTSSVNGGTITNTYGDDGTGYSVRKVWVGDDEFVRPTEITVNAYQVRGTERNLVGTYTLNAGNNWQAALPTLPAGYTYEVEEVNVPSGYTVSVTASDKTYTITNTYDTDIPDDDIPLSDIPDDDVPLADIPDDDVPLTEIPDDDVPLTGDSSRKGLWMALAACSALGMIITGKKWKRKEDDETGEI